MTDREKIAARIRALMAKTVENGCTEDEAIEAARKAAEMLARYNLTVDEVQMRASPFAKDGGVFGELIGDRMWKIADGIAHMIDIRYWSSRPGERPIGVNFFGFAHEVEVAMYLLEVCAGAMRRERDRILAECGLLTFSVRRRRAIPFLDGMADRLRERLRALKPPAPTGRGLVVLRDQLIETALKDAGLHLKGARARSSRDLEAAYADGLAAGDKVALNRGVNGGGATRALLT